MKGVYLNYFDQFADKANYYWQVAPVDFVDERDDHASTSNYPRIKRIQNSVNKGRSFVYYAKT